MRSSEAVLMSLERAQAALAGGAVVAPVVRGGRIRVTVDRLVWECRLADDFEGWGRFRIEASHLARLEREATAWECEQWARGRALRTVRLIDARGACWDGERERLLSVLLTAGTELFEALRVCFDGARWWSLGLDPAVAGRHAARMREMLEDGIKGVDVPPPVRLASVIRGDGRAETYTVRVERALARAGAMLVSVRDNGGQHEVTWSKNDQQFVSTVDRRLGVVSAGFCLSGQDAEQDLTSLASLVGHAR